MAKYVILAESGGDLPQDVIDHYGIYVIPMHVTFGDETKDDGAFPITELFQYYKKSGTLPKTAAANSYEFSMMYERIHQEHPESRILYLAYSAVTTCTYQNAINAIEDRDYIIPFDTKFCSAGQAFVVLQIARFLETNPEADPSEIIAFGENIRSSTHMGFFPGDLDYLRAGGRVSKAAYLGARILSLNPLIEINDGYLEATKKMRGKMDKVSRQLLKEYPAQHHFTKDLLFFIYSHGYSEVLMQELTATAKDMEFREIHWVKCGAVVSTHSGPGAFGIVGLSE